MPKSNALRCSAVSLGLLASAPAFAAEPLLPRYQQGAFSLSASGRVQGDVLLGSGLPSNRTDSAELRRARLALNARYGKDWRGRVSADFADGTRLQDLAVEYRGWPVWVELGRILEPFGLADQSSSRDLPFMERPQATTLGSSYGFGVAANARGKLWAVTGGVFGHTGNDELDGRDQAVTVRGSYTPVRNDDWLLHLGAGASLRKPKGSTLRYSARPETVLVSGLSVQSAALTGVKQVRLANGEVALRRGPVLVSAELLSASVGRETGPEPSYSGYYVEGSWALTGERRDYSTRQGSFDGLKPKRPLKLSKGLKSFREGVGAVELAARFGATDFTDPVLGGEKGRVASVGVNWTPVERLRVQLNALAIEEQRGAVKEDDTVVQMRVQFSF